MYINIIDKKTGSRSKMKKRDNALVFGTFPYEADDDKVFVDMEGARDIGDGTREWDKWFEEKPISAITPNDKVIKCIICGEPARQIDHHYPYDGLDNRCERHRKSLVDIGVYEEFGIGIEVCKEHHRMLNLRSSIGAAMTWIRDNDSRDCEMFKALDKAYWMLEKYMAHKWPDETLGPKEEARDDKV